MDVTTLNNWLEALSTIMLLITGIVTALWAYTKYVLERGLLPSCQLNVDCRFVGAQANKSLIEVLVCLKNLGASTLVASDIRVDILYLQKRDVPKVFGDSTRPTFGRLRFVRSLRKELSPYAQIDNRRGIQLIPYDTFVRPGVEQTYPFITAIPKFATYVLIWASFQYTQHPTPMSRLILSISRHLGLIQYSLGRITQPHTIERVFQSPQLDEFLPPSPQRLRKNILPQRLVDFPADVHVGRVAGDA